MWKRWTLNSKGELVGLLWSGLDQSKLSAHSATCSRTTAAAHQRNPEEPVSKARWCLPPLALCTRVEDLHCCWNIVVPTPWPFSCLSLFSGCPSMQSQISAYASAGTSVSYPTCFPASHILPLLTPHNEFDCIFHAAAFHYQEKLL